MSRLLGVVLFLLPLGGLAEPTAGAPLIGTTTPVNAGPGDQTDPHVSGDAVAYTSSVPGGAEIRYHSLLTAADTSIPTNGGLDFLSDISGNTIVYTHLTSAGRAIYSFDITTHGPPVELAPQVGSLRERSAIGGPTVAWVDFGFGGSTSNPELVAYDRATGVATRLTNEADNDTNPAVSPNGMVIVYERCANFLLACNIWEATRAAGEWTTHALTSTAEDEHSPDTNGVLVVYHSVRGGESDIYWQPVGGGAEQRLVIPGVDRNPAISGTFIAFEHYSATAAVPNFDIFLYDFAANVLYQLTNTSTDEMLTDVSVDPATHLVRVVWTANEGTDSNVYAFSFQQQESCTGNSQDVCENPGQRPLLSTLTLVRTSGDPDQYSSTFGSPTEEGLVCIENNGATSGRVFINDRQRIGPGAFHIDRVLIARSVDLESTNTLKASIAGAPGSSYTLRIYGEDPVCVAQSGQRIRAAAGADLRVAGYEPSRGERLPGIRLVTLSSGERLYDLEDGMPAPGAFGGCSTGGGEFALAGLALLGLWLVRGARAEVRVRVRRDR